MYINTYGLKVQFSTMLFGVCFLLVYCIGFKVITQNPLCIPTNIPVANFSIHSTLQFAIGSTPSNLEYSSVCQYFYSQQISSNYSMQLKGGHTLSKLPTHTCCRILLVYCYYPVVIMEYYLCKASMDIVFKCSSSSVKVQERVSRSCVVKFADDKRTLISESQGLCATHTTDLVGDQPGIFL
jgi:hypothetical protein